MKNKVCVFKSVSDFHYEKISNVIFVTGLSGSGKSFLAKQLAKQNNATIFQPEWLIHYSHVSDELKPFFEKFIQKHKIQKFVETTWNNAKCEDKNLELKKYINLLVEEFLKTTETNKKYIIEGLKIFTMIDFNLIKNHAIIVKGTSSFNSLKNRIKRDYQKRKNLKFSQKTKWFFKCLKQSRVYQFKHRKILNKFIKQVQNT